MKNNLAKIWLVTLLTIWWVQAYADKKIETETIGVKSSVRSLLNEIKSCEIDSWATAIFENGDRKIMEKYDCKKNGIWFIHSNLKYKWQVEHNWWNFICYDYSATYELTSQSSNKKMETKWSLIEWHKFWNKTSLLTDKTCSEYE